MNLIIRSTAQVALCAAIIAHIALSGESQSNIPGYKTAANILASSADGMSRYLANDGPIQPALTAIGGLPIRGIEMANKGISSISSSLNNGAQSLARSAGNEGNIRMPGMQTLESVMPAAVVDLGGMMHGAIRSKNRFIMNQAQNGIQAGNRLAQMMQNSAPKMMARSSHGASMGAGDMLSGAQDAMAKGAEDIKQQLKQSIQGTMGRMQQMQGMGENMRNQAQGITRTLSNGLQVTASQLQKTGEQVMDQLQGGMKQNSKAMTGIVGSLHGSMGNMGQNAQKGIQGVLRHAQNAATQMSGHLQRAASMPMNMLQSLGSGLGGMMKGGSGAASSAKY